MDIEVGDYFICKSVFNEELLSTDIFAKVLAIFPDCIYIMRCTEYGFEQLTPVKMALDEFTQYYTKLHK